MMLGKNLKLTLLFALLVAFIGVNGQISFHLTYDSLNFPTPSTQSFGGTVRYQFAIHNNSGTAFIDSLRIKFRSNTGVFTLVEYDSVVIPIGGVFNVDTIDTVSVGRYGGGINILVIWPTAPNPVLTDSIKDTLIVLTVGVDEGLSNTLPIDVFPIPSQEELFFRHRDPLSVPIVATEIWNVSGQRLRRFKGLPWEVYIGDLPQGLYFIRIEDEQGQSMRVKMIKQ
jgi:hypothetical protein